MKAEDAQVLATLLVPVASVAGAVAVWNLANPIISFAVPAVCTVIAVVTAMEIKRVRYFAWLVLAVQVAVMALVYWS